MYCKNCGQEIDDKAVICVHCGVATGEHNVEQQPYRKVNGLGIAGFAVSIASILFGIYFCITPIVGLVLSILGMTKKKNCTSCNSLALVGMIFGIITLVLWGILWIAVPDIIIEALIEAIMY